MKDIYYGKRLWLFIWILCIAFAGSAQDKLLSPSEFLGFPYGDHFPTFAEANNYFNYLAEHSDLMQIEKYGQTYERRPLMVAVITSMRNMERLDTIRQEHLRGMKENVRGKEGEPLILWLSYGVHGNEAGATTASLEAAYTFLTTQRHLLEDVIIIMDPCVNPDGFSRYTEWYNREASNIPDSRVETVEHQEPWPSGRVNHYLFDLNRDWVWATQIESRQRLELYHEWMPHMHIDFHEQYPDDWTFFPPPAEPIHPAITEFQREIQDSFGLSNAEEYDERQWLYFTGERFDLYYPSYGDTYPLFNGAIGMTYEQGGHGRAGLSYQLKNGDTLTLRDRIDRHVTIGVTTIKRSIELKREIDGAWKSYFNAGRINTAKKVKAYVIICESEAQREHIRDFFKLHRIETEITARDVALYGFSYREDAMRHVKTNEFSLLIRCEQAQSRLLHVLMETESEVSESKTYDITAWAIPYMWGLETVALERIPQMKTQKESSVTRESRKLTEDKSILGYKLRYRTPENMNEIAQLLKNGLKIRAFKAETEDPLFLLLKADNKHTFPESISIDWEVLRSGYPMDYNLGSPKFKLLTKPEILMVHTEKARADNYGFIWHFMEQDLDYPVHRVPLKNLYRHLDDYNTVIFPNGNYTPDSMLVKRLKLFLKKGGKVILLKEAHKLVDAIPELKLTAKSSSGHNPGAIVRVKWDNEDPMGWGMRENLDCLILGNKAYNFPDTMGVKVGYLDEWQTGKGYLDTESKENLANSLRFAYKEYGTGKVIYLLDDPLFRGFWERGKQLFVNTIILL